MGVSRVLMWKGFAIMLGKMIAIIKVKMVPPLKGVALSDEIAKERGMF